MVGSNRIVQATKIVNPVGDEGLDPEEEKKLRRVIVEKAIEALQEGVQGKLHFKRYPGS